MFREPRNSPAGQRTVHGKSNQLPSAEAGSPIANENASPNHASNERIKAWKGMKTSGIPSAPSPSLEAVAVTPKQVPVGVTPVNERVSTLQAIKNHLQDRLESERQLQIDAVKQLEYIGSGDERSTDLNNEVCSRGNKIMVLSQKLTRTQHTLGSLQRATDEYELSAQKVKNAEEAYKSRQRRSSGLNLTLKESKSIRHELDAATAMMNAACQRVEQIESITDTLIDQLSETENELANLQHLRSTELVKHSAEIEKLAHERDCLVMQLAASNSSSDELKQKEEELNKKLEDAKSTAKKLAEELKKADDAKAAQEEALKKEAVRLQMSLEQTEHSKEMLEKELEKKQSDLENAEKRASQGTPKGKGAKQVLPMALKKLKGTQEELLSVREEREKAIKDLEYAKQLAMAREETFTDQLKSLTSESESALNEKQAALESVMKAAAAAANDVATKQEAINTLRMEIAQMKESTEDVLSHMDAVKLECNELSQKLAEACERERCSKEEIAEMKKRHNDMQAAALEREIVLKTELEEHTVMAEEMKSKVSSLEHDYGALLKAKHEYEKQIGSKDASIARLNAEIASQKEKSKALQARVARDVDGMKENVKSISEDKARVEMELKQSLDSISSLHFEVASLQASKNEISGLLEAKEKDIVSLSKNYASQIHELKALVGERDSKITQLEKECVERKTQSDKLLQDIELLAKEYKESEKESQQRIKHIEDTLNDANTRYSELQMQYSQLEEESQSQLATAAEEIGSLKQQFAESLQVKSSLEQALNEERRAHSSERRQLVEQCENLERSKESLLRAIEKLDEQLAMKEDELVASRQVGTPKGEAAKEILKRSLTKVKALQNEISDLKDIVTQKEERIAELEEENKQIPSLKADSSRLVSEMSKLRKVHEDTCVDLDSSMNRVKCLEEEISDITEKLCMESQSKAHLESELESNKATWESSLADKQEQLQLLQSQKYDAEQQVKYLAANLKETKQVLLGMRKNEDSSSEVMRLTFEKVKHLEDDLDQQKQETADLEEKLEEALAAESMLQDTIEEASREKEILINSHSEAIVSLEKNIARLRTELLAEVDKTEALTRELEATHDQNMKLEQNNQSLQCTVEELRATMQDFETKVEQKQEALNKVQAAKESLLAEMSEKISAAERQRHSAQEAADKTSEEVEKVTKNLAIAKSQLSAYERSVTAKESTISSQKKVIDDMEEQAQRLRDEIEKTNVEMQSRDAKLKHLGQAKINVELKLGQSIEELEKELAREQEKNKKVNLTEAAAQKSSQILEQTKIQLAESEKSVRFLVNATKSMSCDLGYSQDQLKKKSDHIADLMKQLQDQTAAAQDMEESFVQKQEELQKALHSAEWLASVAQTRYEKQIEELSQKVEALEKRCQHMEILERQNMELCAIARDRMHTPVQLESHKMHDVDTITSPPNRTEPHSVTARTAVAAVTAAAGLAIMSCASRSPQ